MHNDFISKQLTNFLQAKVTSLRHEEVNDDNRNNIAGKEYEVEFPSDVAACRGEWSCKRAAKD
jgi:hypothetical protein